MAAVAWALLAPCAAVSAGVVEFKDRDAWFDAVARVTTIDFTGFPDHTFITDQYAEQGVLFLDGDDNIVCCSDFTYPNDGAGLDGNQSIHLSFFEPQAYIAVDFPGILRIELFSDGQLFYESPLFGIGGPDVGEFAGLISSDVLFDEAMIWGVNDTDNVNLDDLHFGVPAPGVLPALLVGGVWLGGSRRRSPRRRE